MHCTFTEFYGICIYEEIIFTFCSTEFPRIFLAGVACFDFVRRFIIDLMRYITVYIASLRNSTEFAFMKRFFMRMHVFPFLRNSTEFAFMKRLFLLFAVPNFLEYSLREWLALIS